MVGWWMGAKDRMAKCPCGKTCVCNVSQEFILARVVRHASTVCAENSPFGMIGRLKTTMDVYKRE